MGEEERFMLRAEGLTGEEVIEVFKRVQEFARETGVAIISNPLLFEIRDAQAPNYEGSKIFEQRWDFHKEILPLEEYNGSLSNFLVYEAWNALWRRMKTQDRLSEFYAKEALAGDRYIAHIDLEGSEVVVSLWDEGD